MRSTNWTRFVFSCVVVVSAILFAAPARAASRCQNLDGVITGHFDLAGPDGPAWYGVAYLRFGNDLAVSLASLVDLNNGCRHGRFGPKNGQFSCYEILTFTVEGVGSFKVGAKFEAVCGLEGLSCVLNEKGTLLPEEGTGAFAGATGNVSIQGPFAGGDCSAAQPCIWISDMSGSICTE